MPRRSQRTRAVLTFFAQDHASTEMVYANAEITKAEQAREILAFADYWQAATGENPGLLVFDSQLTTYTVLNELTDRSIGWLTLRQRGRTEIARLAALPANRWKTATITRSGRYRRPQLHEDMIRLKGVDTKVRQIAVRNIGRDEPTLLITNNLTTAAKDLFARYAERMSIENELDAYISGFHLDALFSGVPLNVDLDTTLTVVAGNLYRLFARKLTRYDTATPDTIWRHFLDDDGTLHVTDHGVVCALTCAATTPYSSTPATPTSKPRSVVGQPQPSSSPSRPDDTPTRRTTSTRAHRESRLVRTSAPATGAKRQISDPQPRPDPNRVLSQVRASFQATTAGTPHVLGNRELIHLMQCDAVYR